MISDFFAGVVHLRAHLDGRASPGDDPAGGLSTMVQALMRPRTVEELCHWLGEQLTRVFRAQGAAVMVRISGRWGTRFASETIPEPVLRRCVGVLSDDVAGKPFAAVHGWMIPVAGLEGVIGAVYLHEADISPEAAGELLQAIVDTTGVLLEQGTQLESSAR